MLNAENIKDVEQRRLAWRCRRGMLELDLVLQRFITQHFNHLTLSELQAFDEMLELPDNDFWGLVSSGFVEHKNAARQSIVEKLHAL